MSKQPPKSCPECLFEPYVEGVPHLYGGRATSGMTCYGPRRLKTRVIDSKTVLSAKAPTGEQREDQQAQDVAGLRDGPPVPIKPIIHERAPKEKKLTRAEKVAQKFAALGIRLGSEIDPPNPAARPTKPSRRASGRTRLAPKRTT